MSLTPERRRRIDAICFEALSLGHLARGAFLDAACGCDLALRRDVQALIDAQSAASGSPGAPAGQEETPPLAPGARLGPYEVLSRLGEGGMGIVYEARDTRLGRHVAVKLLPDHAAVASDARLRFVREARAASALNHPNICTIHDFHDHGGRPCLVMELLEGMTLRDRLHQGAFDIADLVRIGAQVADALEAAHGAGVVHRDIKPGNIFTTVRGDAKILDFGLAKLTPDAGVVTTHMRAARAWLDAETHEDAVTVAGVLAGTVAYMSPEQIRGGAVDHRTDIYSLGAVLYEMATGSPPFPRETPALILHAILNDPLLPVRQVAPHVADELAHVIEKALEKDRSLRYQSAAEMRVDLLRLSRGTQGDHARGSRRSSLSFALPAAGLVLSIGVAGWAVYVKREGVDPVPAAGPSRRVTTGPGFHREPAVSPDGRLVAYTSDESGNYDVWVARLDTFQQRRFTTAASRESGAAWFPDGNTLAFVSDRDGQPAIWRAPLFDGDAARKLVDRAFEPAISPDGTRIAFVALAADGRYAVAVAPLDDTGAITVLTPKDDGYWEHRDPAWSPDGRTICYWTGGGLWLVASAGGTPRRLTSSASDREPAWSPDGSVIYFTSSRDGGNRLWRVAARGGTPRPATIESGAESHAHFSRAGGVQVFATSEGDGDLMFRDLANGHEGRLGSEHDQLPAFGPDGRLYFTSERWGRRDIWSQRMSLAGDPIGPPVPVTEGDETESNAACSPDGRWLAYYVTQPTGGIWIRPSSAGASVRLTDVAARESHPAWSPDGTRLAFVSWRDGSPQLWVRAVVNGGAAGDALQITRGPGYSLAPAWSPDGSRIAYIAQLDARLEVAIVPADGSARPRVVTNGASPRRVRWHRPSGRLLVSGKWGQERWEVRWVNSDGTEAQSLAPPLFLGTDDGAVGAFDISPDGRFVAFTRKDARGDVWMRRVQ